MRPLVLALVSLSVALAGCAEAPTPPKETSDADPSTGAPETAGEDEPAPLLGSAPTPPQRVGRQFTLLGYAEASKFHYVLEGSETRNPKLVAPGGGTFTVRFVSVSGFHNLCFAAPAGQRCTTFVDAGEETSVTFEAPASGEIQYWCAPHKNAGMQGTIQFEPAATTATPASPTTPTPATPTPQQPTPAPTPHATASVAIAIKDFQFVDGTLSIPVGSTVTWTNQDDARHSVVLNANQSAALARGESTSQTFAAVGTYAYRCGFHPSMKGTITVQ